MAASPVTGSPVIDADAHVAEALADLQAALPDDLRPLAPQVVTRPGSDPVLTTIEGRPFRPRFPPVAPGERPEHEEWVRRAASDPAQRVRWLDREGIDLAVLYPSLGLLVGCYRDTTAAGAWCRAVNDWLARFCAFAPARLAPVAILPVQGPELALQELERAVNGHGAVAGVVRPNPVGGLALADGQLEALWAAAERLDVPIVVHEGTFGGEVETLGLDRSASYAEAHLFAHPFEQLAAVGSLLLRGVLQRHPRLRLGCFEAGAGWAPYWEDRAARHAELYGGAVLPVRLRDRVWVSADPDEPMLAAVTRLGWGRRVCFASDFPHADAAAPGAVRAVRDLGLPGEIERAVLGGNALALYGDRLRRRMHDGRA